MAFPAVAEASTTLTQEQQAIVDLVMNDPLLLQAILEQAGQVTGEGVPPEGAAALKRMAANQAPIEDENKQLEKRLLGTAKRGK